MVAGDIKLNSPVMLVDESVESTSRVQENIAQSFVNGGALMLHLVEHCLQHDDIRNCILFEDVNLVENDIRVEQQVMGISDQRAFRWWIF